jgi:hypothetical protein
MRYRAPKIKLTRSTDALKQLRPTTGPGCAHSVLVMVSANAASFLKKMFQDAMTFSFVQEKSYKFVRNYVAAG